MTSEDIIQDARKIVLHRLQRTKWYSPEPSKTQLIQTVGAQLIGRYTVAVAGEFQAWLGTAYTFARHEKAQWALKDNLRCEMSQNHSGMLREFAQSCGVTPTIADQQYVAAAVNSMQQNIFANIENVGLGGLTALAVLENASEIFIPILANVATLLGSKNLTYTDVHGEADKAHSQAFLEALQAEMGEGYHNPSTVMRVSCLMTTNYILRIFNDIDVIR
ncbi:MAG: iron-containing redox enzyme family protein [Candidatus Pacebacteria bacterium]|nr:iron-containing redox enzyme family protein [Candidatus Paceibacterota bacterium]